MLQCVAVCCRDLKVDFAMMWWSHIAMSRNSIKSMLTCVLQCDAACYSMLYCAAVCCSVLQCVAVCCSVLQCVAVCRRDLKVEFAMMCWSHIAMSRNKINANVCVAV